MRQTTRGIVLNHIKYQETSIIAHIFTEVFGKQSYLVKGVRTARSKYPMALFQPLMPLDLLVAPAKHGTLHHLVEVGCYQPISNILADLRKATMATFLAELFYKAVSEADQGGIFFAFLLQVVRELDALTQHHALFYLRCMLSLAQHLGFGCTTASQLNKELMHSGYPAKRCYARYRQAPIAIANTRAGTFLTTPRPYPPPYPFPQNTAEP